MLKIEPIVARPAGTASAATPLPVALPVGTVFAVEAVRDSASGQLMLLLAGRRFTLKPGGAADEVVPGSKLNVRVLRNEPEIELALVGKSNDVAAALRREVPQQASPLRLLANLQLLTAQPEDPANEPLPARESLPAPVRAAVESVWRSVPETRQLATPEGLQRACLDSGARLENLLATGDPAKLDAELQNDWKAVLYRLKDVLMQAGGTRQAAGFDRSDTPLPTRHGELTAMARETPTLARLDSVPAALGELAQQATEAIARVHCNQLASLDQNQQAAFPLLLEIPYRAPDGPGLLRLRIEKETREHAEAAGPVWSVTFALDLGALGPLRGRVTLAEGRVSVTLQPETASLASAIDARVEELRGTLADAGLPVGKLTCVRSDPVGSSPSGAWLINLRA